MTNCTFSSYTRHQCVVCIRKYGNQIGKYYLILRIGLNILKIIKVIVIICNILMLIIRKLGKFKNKLKLGLLMGGLLSGRRAWLGEPVRSCCIACRGIILGSLFLELETRTKVHNFMPETNQHPLFTHACPPQTRIQCW